MFKLLFENEDYRQELLDEIFPDGRLPYSKDLNMAHIATEDDYVVNKQDPELRSLYANFNTTDALESDALDDLDAIVTGIICAGTDTDTDGDIVERVSIKEAIEESNASKKKPVAKKKYYSAFEQWVDDVVNGRKSYNDPL